ncbi:MAG: S24 family peptidase [Candidatus Moranbacteria bacterium]|nr:S24 family peptidase [Candidatus Moranbacteria bacterium]
MQNLTDKQKLVLETVREMSENGQGNPTTYGIAKYLQRKGMSESVKTVSQVIEALEKKELVKRDVFRKIYLIENGNMPSGLEDVFQVPVYGLASAGDALAFAEDNVDGYLQISESLLKPSAKAQLFAVKTLGDSMNREKINDGDYVIFEKKDQDFEYNGKIVVAVVNGMATIKKYKKLGSGLIGLFPNSTNKFHQPIYIHESDSFMIAGVFRKVLPVKFISL